MSLLRTLVIGVLFFLMIYLYAMVQSLKTENARLKADLEAATASPQDQLKGALSLAESGDARALGKLQAVAQRFSNTPEGREAARRAAELERALAKSRAAAEAKARSAKDKRDLETLLKMPPFDGSRPPPRDLSAPSCRSLEDNPEKFSGHRITVTDSVKDMGGFLSFSECSGVIISNDKLGSSAKAALKARLGPGGSGKATLSGLFQGLDFYPDEAR